MSCRAERGILTASSSSSWRTLCHAIAQLMYFICYNIFNCSFPPTISTTVPVKTPIICGQAFSFSFLLLIYGGAGKTFQKPVVESRKLCQGAESTECVCLSARLVGRKGQNFSS